MEKQPNNLEELTQLLRQGIDMKREIQYELQARKVAALRKVGWDFDADVVERLARQELTRK